MKNEERFCVAVKGLVFCDNRFLILQRSDRARGEHYYWELPGGRMEFGEYPEEALRRELKEETGMYVKSICPLNVWTFFREVNIQTVGINFLCTTDTKDVKLSNEHIDFRWIEEVDLINYSLHPTIKDELYKWNWKEIKRKVSNQTLLFSITN